MPFGPLFPLPRLFLTVLRHGVGRVGHVSHAPQCRHILHRPRCATQQGSTVEFAQIIDFCFGKVCICDADGPFPLPGSAMSK